MCTLDEMFLALSSSKPKNSLSVGINLVSAIQGLYRASTRARGPKKNTPADAGRRIRGGPVAGGGPVRCDDKLVSYAYGHSG
eukprot:scaffold14098_cov129-Isochrysis_galbana.AAC.5